MSSTVIGIDMCESEIRIVCTDYLAGEIVPTNAGFCPMPVDAFVKGRIVDAGAIALAIKRLLEQVGVKLGGTAAFSIATIRIASVVIAVPKVSDSELAAVVAAEAEHYDILKGEGGKMGFVALQSPKTASGSGPIPVILFSVNDQEANTFKEVAQRCSLDVLGLEPPVLSKGRTTLMASGGANLLFVLGVEEEKSYAAVLMDGYAVAYRLIDTGEQQLLAKPLESALVTVPAGLEFASSGIATIPSRANSTTLNLEAVNSLSLDVKRTLDYLQRENPELMAITKVDLAIDNPDLAELGTMMTKGVGIPCEIVRMPSRGIEGSNLAREFEGDQGVRYLVAYGLAMVNAKMGGIELPRVDLFANARTLVEQQASRRNFIGAMSASVLGIVVGVLGFILFTRQIDRVRAETKRVQVSTAQTKDATNQTVQERLRRDQQYKVLRREGVPLGSIMDYLVASLKPGVGIKSVSISPDLKVAIIGEALREESMIQMTQQLGQSPVLEGLIVNSFNRGVGSSLNVITFTLNAQTVSASRVMLPPDVISAQPPSPPGASPAVGPSVKP